MRRALGRRSWPLALATVVAAPPVDPGVALRSAREAADAGRYPEALRHYEELRGALPDEPSVPYNMGVLAYRQGEFERAAELFADSLALANDPKLRAQTAYNLGTAEMAGALQGMGQTEGGPVDLDPAKKALERAIDHYREAIELDPQDLDARANAELAHRRLRELEALEQQMQQQQPERSESQENEDSSDQTQSASQQQPGDGSQDESSQSSSSQQPQQPPQSEEQEAGEEQGQPQPPDTQQEQQEQEQQDEQAGGQQADQEPRPEDDEPAPRDAGDQDAEQDAAPQDADAGESSEQDAAAAASDQPAGDVSDRQPQGMSREEAERLLQGVRDRDRRRAEERAQAAAAKQPPVDKDW